MSENKGPAVSSAGSGAMSDSVYSGADESADANVCTEEPGGGWSAEVVARLLLEVLGERRRQHVKWGRQDWPNGTGPGKLVELHGESWTRAVLGGGSIADGARRLCDAEFKVGTGTYAHILFEEVAEALQEDDAARLRVELVQVAAVAVAWVEAIDRRAGRRDDCVPR